MKILAITQARTGSTRLPGKVLKTINGQTLLNLHLTRILQSKNINQLLVATTVDPADDAIEQIAKGLNLPVYRGSIKNVLDRFYQAALPYQPDWIVRLTSDCPLIDPRLIDKLIEIALKKEVDYCSNGLNPTFPDGVDIEVFRFSALQKAWHEAGLDSEKEHVTPYIYNNSDFKHKKMFKAYNFENATNYSQVRLTVDEQADLEVIDILIDKLGTEQDWQTYADFYLSDDKISKLNKHINRNEGYHTSLKSDSYNNMITKFEISDQMIKRAQEIIPGGAHTYSKGPDQSPLLGPKVISHGKGSHVWDVDGNEYIDWAMGLTAVSLGHAFEPILSAVRHELEKGVNFQCPSPIETELAELFLEAVPSADMVKFAKNGSTVTTAALKLARAYTGKKYVAFCSDHGFFSYDDWYIGAKACNAGVPDEMASLTLSFKYNDIQSLEALFNKYPNQIAGVILEPMEFDLPLDNFLQRVRELCTKNGTVLVIDEMITGFKLGFPGAHTLLGVEPDLSTWGKGVANGFSACMLAGKKEIMKLGGIDHDQERVFLISTTHGAETHSLAAAIASIKYTRDHKTIESDHQKGLIIRENMNNLINKHGLEKSIEIKGHPCWLLMIFKDKNGVASDALKTLFYQEVIKHGILFRGTFNISISHSDDDLQKTFAGFDKAMSVYHKALEEGHEKYLVGEAIKPVFRKYN